MRNDLADHILRAAGRFALPAMLITGTVMPGAIPAARAAPQRAQARTQAGPAFPGPALGVPATQKPLPADFALSSYAAANDQPARVGGETLAVTTAIRMQNNGGLASLDLAVPGSGHFHARFGVASDDATSQPALLQVQVLGREGYPLHLFEATTTKAGGAQSIDVDLQGGVAITLSNLGKANTLVFGMGLSGSARALRTAAGIGSAATTGATPLAPAGARLSCNASPITTPMSVGRVPIPVGVGFSMLSCGSALFPIPAGTQGTFTLRYGTADDSPPEPIPSPLVLRAFDARGHLLRKVIGVSNLGGGLHPLWIDLRDAHGVAVTLEASVGVSNRVVVTGLGIVPRTLPAYRNLTEVLFGASGGEAIPIPPAAFANSCNSYLGTSDSSVAGKVVLANTYVRGLGCGMSTLILTGAHGHLRARFGIADGSSPGTLALQIAVLDQNSHPLFQTTLHAATGQPSLPIDMPIASASIVNFSFVGATALTGVLYDVRLAGSATVYSQVYPPVESPVLVQGGKAISAYDLVRDCNSYIADTDMLLIHEAALEQWTLRGQECGIATLKLGTGTLPRHLFSARYGLPVANQADGIATLQVSALDTGGKVVRSQTLTARSGYGPQQFSIALAGAASLQIAWVKNRVAVFAMTLS